jgi:hypothetical protein
MTRRSEKLAAVQLAGHIAIDHIYADLANSVEAAVLEQAARSPDGKLTPAAALGVITALRAKLVQASPQLAIAVMNSVLGAVTAALEGKTLTYDPIGQSFDQYQARQQVVRTLQTSQQNVLEQTGSILLKGVASGLATSLIANRARQYFSPFFAPRRDATGKLLRSDRQGALTSWPGRAGMASNAVRVVMLDQTGRMHASTTYRLAKQNNLGLLYRLSPKHRDTDECTALATQDVGYGRGVYPADDAPTLPRHPRCRCYYSTTPLVRS